MVCHLQMALKPLVVLHSETSYRSTGAGVRCLSSIAAILREVGSVAGRSKPIEIRNSASSVSA